MPTSPSTHLLGPDDTADSEVESRAELDRHLSTGSLAGLTVQGLRLDTEPVPDLGLVELTDTLFVGCRFASRQVEADLIRRGAHVLPPFADLPYSTQPPRLYTPEDLVDGFATAGFAGMFDTLVYEHFRTNGGALPPVREALAQRMHDHGVDNALADTTRSWLAVHGPGSVIGVMGGHAVPRGTPAYRLAATLGWELARADRLVVTGGGPGVMEAANLGAYLSGRTPEELAAAIDLLATAPDFADHDPYTAAAVRVRTEFGPGPDGPASTTNLGATPPTGNGTTPPADGTTNGLPPAQRAGGADAVVADTVGWARRGGLSIPTWLYGHEPANLFAGRIAKYFSNALREDTLLRLARGGIVFAAGRAGTVQEVFQAATKTFYGTDGASGAYVFLDRAFWTETLPIESLLRPLFTLTPFGDLTDSIHLTDDVHEAVRLLVGD
ncbi:LOG family protein [Micromonospora sp. NPDC050397]|uniref:LOG family protein n=1 Tax=Micromonospora sp. NPDC050397 TaxID=3364279 RepID=UPI00384EFBB1